jgi:hypothetical protein
MSAYTTAVWRLDGLATRDDLDVIDRDGRVAMIDCEGVDVERIEANARLIAAAPELARLLSRLAGFAAHHASDSAMAAGGRDLVAEARALLARIEDAP